MGPWTVAFLSCKYESNLIKTAFRTTGHSSIFKTDGEYFLSERTTSGNALDASDATIIATVRPQESSFVGRQSSDIVTPKARATSHWLERFGPQSIADNTQDDDDGKLYYV